MQRTEETKKLAYHKRIQGIALDFVNVPNVVLAGFTLTPAQLQQRYQAWLDLADQADAKLLEYKAALAARNAAGKALTPIDRALRKNLEGTYGDNCKQILDLGYDPTKPAHKAAAVKAGAVVKATATRAVRHTLGKNQKKAVKGSDPTPPAAGTPAK